MNKYSKEKTISQEIVPDITGITGGAIGTVGGALTGKSLSDYIPRVTNELSNITDKARAFGESLRNPKGTVTVEPTRPTSIVPFNEDVARSARLLSSEANKFKYPKYMLPLALGVSGATAGNVLGRYYGEKATGLNPNGRTADLSALAAVPTGLLGSYLGYRYGHNLGMPKLIGATLLGTAGATAGSQTVEELHNVNKAFDNASIGAGIGRLAASGLAPLIGGDMMLPLSALGSQIQRHMVGNEEYHEDHPLARSVSEILGVGAGIKAVGKYLATHPLEMPAEQTTEALKKNKILEKMFVRSLAPVAIGSLVGGTAGGMLYNLAAGRDLVTPMLDDEGNPIVTSERYVGEKKTASAQDDFNSKYSFGLTGEGSNPYREMVHPVVGDFLDNHADSLYRRYRMSSPEAQDVMHDMLYRRFGYDLLPTPHLSLNHFKLLNYAHFLGMPKESQGQIQTALQNEATLNYQRHLGTPEASSMQDVINKLNETVRNIPSEPQAESAARSATTEDAKLEEAVNAFNKSPKMSPSESVMARISRGAAKYTLPVLAGAGLLYVGKDIYDKRRAAADTVKSASENTPTSNATQGAAIGAGIGTGITGIMYAMPKVRAAMHSDPVNFARQAIGEDAFSRYGKLIHGGALASNIALTAGKGAFIGAGLGSGKSLTNALSFNPFSENKSAGIGSAIAGAAKSVASSAKNLVGKVQNSSWAGKSTGAVQSGMQNLGDRFSGMGAKRVGDFMSDTATNHAGKINAGLHMAAGAGAVYGASKMFGGNDAQPQAPAPNFQSPYQSNIG